MAIEKTVGEDFQWFPGKRGLEKSEKKAPQLVWKETLYPGFSTFGQALRDFKQLFFSTFGIHHIGTTTKKGKETMHIFVDSETNKKHLVERLKWTRYEEVILIEVKKSAKKA